MNIWDKIANAQLLLSNTGNKTGPINTSDGKVAFGATLDAVKALPKNPGSFNDSAEVVRKSLVDLAATNPEIAAGTIGFTLAGPVGAVGMAGLAFGVRQVDDLTNGGASKLLMAGAKEVRSNYAFQRDVAEKNAAIGFLTGLAVVSAGVLGGVAGFATAGPGGAYVGATLAAAAAAKLQRNVAESDALGKKLAASARLAKTDKGQEEYNLGRDVTRNVLAKVPGFRTLGDTSRGFGAIVSGLINVAYEWTTAPDAPALKGIGMAAKTKLSGPIVEPVGSFSSKINSEAAAERVTERLLNDAALIRRTMDGEETAYTPVFKFYRESTPAELLQREEFNSEAGQIGAHLLAGASDEQIGLVLLSGRGIEAATEILAAKHAARYAELARFEDAIATVNDNGHLFFDYQGKTLQLSKKFKNNVDFVKAEMENLRSEVRWLDDALDIEGSMTKRTVSRWAYVEKLRNDFAKEQSERRLATGAVTEMETAPGKAYQYIYQRSPFSKPIRFVDRITDDAPKPLINYNEPIMANTRVGTSLRSAEKFGASTGKENVRIFNDWMNARTEVQKDAVLESYVAQGMKLLANKYRIPDAMIDDVVQKHIETHRTVKGNAKVAKETQSGYMNDPYNPEQLLSDPQLITQLSNGFILPDWKFYDSVLKEYSKTKGAKLSFIQKNSEGAKIFADEVNSLWRSLTLLRSGYPINVIKDTHIRAWGDAALFGVWKNLGEDALEAAMNSSNTVWRIKQATKALVNPKQRVKYVREQIDIYEAHRQTFADSLKKLKYDVKNPPEKPVTDATILRHLDSYKDIENTLVTLRDTYVTLTSGAPAKRISKDYIKVGDETFNSASGGRFGSLFMSKITQKDDLRRAMAGIRELEIEAARRGTKGTRSINPTEESLHLQSWEQILNDKIRFDDVARMILQGKSKKVIVEWLRSEKGFSYMDRFAAARKNAPEVYERVKTMVDLYAPSAELKALVISDKLTVPELVKLYPDVNTRPVVFTDLVDDMLHQSTMSKNYRQLIKDAVAWLSTAPTSKLGFNPYYRVKYEEELQGQILIANAQGRKLTPDDKLRFEKLAHNYALKEYREKLNSFHRDMNYSGVMNYLLAFFPAVVEQFRAYARITLDHPDFIVKKLRIATLPEQLTDVKTDANGNEYIEVDLPFYGLKGRIPTSWFNVDNPTGGQMISVSPYGSALVNEFAKRTQIENAFTDMVLPYGVQRNSLNALQPNTVRRMAQVFRVEFLGNAEQFNKDVNMFNNQARFDFVKYENREPGANDWADIQKESERKAFYVAVLRALSAATLPVQARIVTPISSYVDIYSQYQEKYGADGFEKFNEDYPEYYMLADSLTESTSGVRPDKTAVGLIKKNKDAILRVVSAVGNEEHLSVLGAIFNDDDYAFSSAAQAYLQDTKIPGSNKKFRDVSDAFANGRLSIVNKGWKDLNTLQETVKNYLLNSNPPIDPTRGVGASIVDSYKQDYIAQMKTQNPMWWDEWESMSFGGAGSRQASLVKALTTAIEDDNLWKDLSKQNKWHVITDYLQFRFKVNSMLEQRGTTIDSARAYDIREYVRSNVEQLKAQDTGFAKLYDRYFSEDKFDYVYEGV